MGLTIIERHVRHMFGIRARVHDVPILGHKGAGATYHSLIDLLFFPQYPYFKEKISRPKNRHKI